MVYGGTGQLISPAARYKSTSAPGDEEGVTLNLANTSIAESAKTILGDILGLNYSVNPNLAGKITIQTSTPVSRSDLVDLFQNALRSSGATIIRNGGMYQVEPADQVSRSVPEITVGSAGSDDGVLGTSARVVQLKYVAASEMFRILEPMAPKGAIRADDARNTLTLSGTGSDIAAMLDAISVFDADVMKGMSVAIVPVVASQPDAMIEDLRAVFGSDREGPMKGMVRFIPNQRTKSILVVSPQQTYLTRAERWIRSLDAKAHGPDKQLFTYSVRNRPAGELVGIIQSMFSSSPSPRDMPPPGGRNVAPRYQQAAVQSPQAGASRSDSPLATVGSPAGGGAGGGTPGGGVMNLNTQDTAASNDPGTQSDAASSNASLGMGDEGRVRVALDESNNTLLVLASRQDYQRVQRIIQNLDIVPNQVLIEATIAEVTLTDDLKFGVRWHFAAKKSDFGFTGGGGFGSVFPGFSYALAAANAQVTLNALNTLTKVNVISSPSLTVLDKQTATLQIGDQVPVVTQSAVQVATVNAPIVNSVSYRDTGVILSITPRIHESGRVFLKIEQEVSSVANTTTSTIDSPTIKQRRVKTTVQLNDGEALALGGLIQDQITDSRNQIPILGDIPLIGNAFKEKGGAVGKTELVVLITPYVVRNLNEAREITDEYRRKFDVYMPRQRGTQRSLHEQSKGPSTDRTIST